MDASKPILIVEDSAIQRLMLQRMLEGAGHATVAAQDGLLGLAAAREHHPRLIITDIAMPNMDGYEMCRAIKQDPELGKIGVLILTGLDDPREVIRGLNAGADNFLTKSSDEAHILARVDALLGEAGNLTDDGGALQVVFAGENYAINATRRQTINLLLSTYENAVRQNRQLIETQQELKMLNQHLEEKVRQRTRELEVANRAKSVFIANMSHELRTPMNAIIGMTDLVCNTSLDQEQQECLNIVRGASDTLLFFINTLLDFTQMEIGTLQVREQPFCLREELERALLPFFAKARAKGLSFHWRVREDVPEQCAGDFLRVQQILAQLIANAVKFTNSGGVSVEVTRTVHGVGEDTLCFAVRDTGIGIEPELAEVVFESFVQGDGSATRKYGGAGLGLSLVKGLSHLLKGRVWFESAPQSGSAFFCEMPFRLAERRERGRKGDPETGLSGRPLPWDSGEHGTEGGELGGITVDPAVVGAAVRDLERLLAINDLDAEKRCAVLRGLLSHTPLHGLVAELEQRIRDLDFEQAQLGLRRLAHSLGL
ncbi:MAG: response regulator [Magnetococcales bacterium]|nr:response regulator [Magnetococcales bacterium]